MCIEQELVAPEGFATQVLHVALQTLMPDRFTSATAAKKACRGGWVLVDDLVGATTTGVASGQNIKVLVRVKGAPELRAQDAPVELEVAYEDTDMGIVVKPQGMSTAKSGADSGVTAAQCIKYALQLTPTPGILRRPQEVHRLDAETGGLLVCAKTQPALRALSCAFAERAVKKRYRALVRGRLEGCGKVLYPLAGKPCWTEYRATACEASRLCGHVTTVDLWPHSGRTHQLRRHMAMIGHAILGDVAYWAAPVARPAAGIGEQHCRLQEAQLLDAPQAGIDGDRRAVAARVHSDAAREAAGRGVKRARTAADDTDAPLVPEQPVAGAAGGAPARADVARSQTGGDSAHGGEDAADGEAKGAKGWGRKCTQEEALAERMCLWAVQCKLAHPVTGKALDVEIPEPELFMRVRQHHSVPV